jgi:hypothetical protein
VPVCADLELDKVTDVEVMVAAGLEEDVLSAVVEGDEAGTLGGVESPHRSLCLLQ